MSYPALGNQQEFRLGPEVAPAVLGTLLTVAEPLFWSGVILTNTTAGALTYTAYLVAPGSVAVAANQMIPGVNVPPNDTLSYGFPGDGIPISGGGVPPANDTIQHVASGVGLNVTAVLSRRNR